MNPEIGVYTKLNRLKIIVACKKIIEAILNQRADNAYIAEKERQDIIEKQKSKWYYRIFDRKASDLAVWKSISYLDLSEVYKKAEAKSRGACEYQLNAVEDILALAVASTDETITITDIGFSHIKLAY